MAETIIDMIERHKTENQKERIQGACVEHRINTQNRHDFELENSVTWTEKDIADCADLDLSHIRDNDVATTVVFIEGIRPDIACIALKTKKSGYIAASGDRQFYTLKRAPLVKFFAETIALPAEI